MQVREQLLLGVVLLGAGLFALPFMVIMPEWQGAEKDNRTIKQNEQLTTTTDAAISKLRLEIARIKKLAVVPAEVNVRKIEGGKTQEAVKAMLDDIITLARHYNNELVTLTPFNAMPVKAAPVAQSSGRRRRRRGPAPEPEKEKAAPPPPTAQKFGYNMTIRGTYPDIEEFVAVLSTHPELIEMQTLNFENEGSHTREGLEQGSNNNAMPMSATIKLVLYLDKN